MRILYLEDEPKDAELVQAELEADGIVCDLTRADTHAEFLAFLRQGGFELILADYTLPLFDGISALKIAQEIRPQVPFIFVSGTMGEELAIEALKQGATDYVFKTRLSRIAPSVRRALREADERSQRKRAEEELQQLVDLVPQLLIVLAPDGKCIHANRVAREYTGLTLREYRSVDLIAKVIHPADAEKMRTLRERGFSEAHPLELEARLLGKDGNYRWFLFRYNPLVEQGHVRRWYASATEIESRKKEEDRVRKENVRLEERTRIAQELHDTLLQTFLSASMLLHVAADDVSPESSVKPLLERILEIMKQGIQEGRNTIRDLRSTGTPDLVQALSRVQEDLAVQSEISFRVNVVGREEPLRPPVWHEIYRIGREALVNAFSHSRADCVEFEIEYADSDLRMRVRDNGRGIDPQVLRTGRDGHWGLAGMRERAAKVGGLLNISSSATTGTEVQLSIPGRIAFQASPTDTDSNSNVRISRMNCTPEEPSIRDACQ